MGKSRSGKRGILIGGMGKGASTAISWWRMVVSAAWVIGMNQRRAKRGRIRACMDAGSVGKETRPGEPAVAHCNGMGECAGLLVAVLVAAHVFGFLLEVGEPAG